MGGIAMALFGLERLSSVSQLERERDALMQKHGSLNFTIESAQQRGLANLQSEIEQRAQREYDRYREQLANTPTYHTGYITLDATTDMQFGAAVVISYKSWRDEMRADVNKWLAGAI